MRVLVTGSSGFIGKAVRASLERKGHELVPYNLPYHDVRDAKALAERVENRGIGGIINLAGMLGTPELFGHEAEAAAVNVIGAINVYDVAAKFGIPVVQIGTGHKGQPNPYAITKGCAEDIAMARVRYQKQRIAVVRAYHVYGPHQAAGPPHGTASVHKFFPTFACRALTGMPLEFCGGGGQVIDPVYVDDCADVLVGALNGPYGRVIEAGNGQPFTVRQVGYDIAYWAGGYDIAYRAGDTLPLRENTPGRDGEPEGAVVKAHWAACNNPWPYKVKETVEWYRQWLTRS